MGGPWGGTFTFPDIPGIITDQQTLANTAFSNANTYLNNILDYINGVDDPLAVDNVSVTVDVGTAPTLTTSSSTASNPSSVPAVPDDDVGAYPVISGPGTTSWDDMVTYLGDFPVFDVDIPTLSYAAKPADLGAVEPDIDVSITTDFTYPQETNPTLPEVPTLEEYNIPSLESYLKPIDLLRNEHLISAYSATSPTISIQWNEDPYSSATLTEITSTLLEWLQGGTGLSPVIEQAIWDRARNREDQVTKKGEQKLLVEYAQQGFTRPQGAHLAALDFFIQEAQNKIADLSREIAIKQADLEQQNIKFAIEKVIALEQLTLSNHNSMMQRAHEVAVTTQKLAIDLFNAEISRVQASAQLATAAVANYESRLKGSLATLERYKGELEGQKLISDLNNALIRDYTARVDAAKTTAEIYKIKVDAIVSKIQGETIKLQQVSNKVQNYAAVVAAKNAEYQGYSAQIEAENSKISAYGREIEAFNNRLQSYATYNDVAQSQSSVYIEQAKTNVASYQAAIEKYKAKIAATIDSYRMTMENYRSAIAQSADLRDHYDTQNSRLVQAYSMGLQGLTTEATIAQENAKINIENARNYVQLYLKALTDNATIGAQLAASSLSALNISAGSNQGINYANNYNEQVQL